MRGKAKLKSLFKLSCHLRGAPENKCVKDEINKSVGSVLELRQMSPKISKNL